jgi:hypothetical protein
MEWLKNVIDKALGEMSKEPDIFMKTPGNVPMEMLDKSIAPTNDWKGWKPIDSIVTDSDIDKFELEMGIGLPESYRAYLKYKHFYQLRLPDIAVNLPRHLPDRPLSALREFVFHSHEPELIIGRKYIYFADFHDYGLLCFDANEPAIDNEYHVVYIDHENLNDVHFYSNNFRELLEADSERGNDFIDRLNEYHK